MGDDGLETTAFPSGNTANSNEGGAESGAVGAENGPIDADLATLIQVWPELPDLTKRAILDAVRTARPTTD